MNRFHSLSVCVVLATSMIACVQTTEPVDEPDERAAEPDEQPRETPRPVVDTTAPLSGYALATSRER
jgi:hypothetical protein